MKRTANCQLAIANCVFRDLRLFRGSEVHALP